MKHRVRTVLEAQVEGIVVEAVALSGEADELVRRRELTYIAASVVHELRAVVDLVADIQTGFGLEGIFPVGVILIVELGGLDLLSFHKVQLDSGHESDCRRFAAERSRFGSLVRKVVVIHCEVGESPYRTELSLEGEAEHDVGEIVLIVVMPDDRG